MSLKYPSFRTFNLSSLHESTKGLRNYFMPVDENWWIVSSHQFGASSGTGYLMLFAWIFFLTLTKGCLISGFQCMVQSVIGLNISNPRTDFVLFYLWGHLQRGQKQPQFSLQLQIYPFNTRSVLSKFRVRTGVSPGNQIHSSNLWILGIPKMYMGTLGYNVRISL